MTHSRRLLLPLRAYILGSSHSNSLLYPRNTVKWKYEHLKLCLKNFKSILQDRAVRFQYRLISQRRCIQTLCFSGIKLSLATMYIQGSFYLRPCVAYATDGKKNTYAEESSSSGLLEDDPYSFLSLTRKLWLPAFLILTVFASWGHPIALTVKVFIFLLSTNPSPFSVYVFVEQLRHQSMREHPFLHEIKPFYAKKVDVEDYKLLSLARVEIRDQKITLIGILGSWWVLQYSPPQGNLSFFESIALKNR